jgi:hypothetical protein
MKNMLIIISGSENKYNNNKYYTFKSILEGLVNIIHVTKHECLLYFKFK